MSRFQPNGLWPGWETVRVIGEGSFGAVYEIKRENFGDTERAAVKHISIPQKDSEIRALYNNGYDDESVTATFHSYMEDVVTEYSLMRKLNGFSNVVNCDDYRIVQHSDGIGWDIFIKMELLTPLMETLSKSISEKQAIDLGIDICKALILCKEHGIIHRDIKPENIFISENGDYKLGDFGIAKTMEKTSGGTKTGTYNYMAPEICNNQKYNLTADIYSLGMVLYWMMNERRGPFLPLPPLALKVSDIEDARQRRFSGESLPSPAHGSEDFQRIILKACSFRMKDRYQHPKEMLEALELLDSTVIDPPHLPDSKPIRWKPWLITGCAVLFTSLTLFLNVHIWSEADCFNPSRCKICGKIGQASLSHVWTEATCTSPKTCLLCGTTSGTADSHSWRNATCSSPRTCTLCGKTSGSIIDHTWNNATCTTPKTCAICGQTEGSALDHHWERATSTQPKKCSVCGEEIGEASKQKTLSAGFVHTIALRTDGQLVSTGDNEDGQRNVSGWSHVKSIAAGYHGTVGLLTDGTVVTTDNMRSTANWSNIVEIAVGPYSVMGLRADGSVSISTASVNSSTWSDIIEIATSDYHSVGLRANGTVVAIGNNDYGQCNVSTWADITSIAVGDEHTIGLHSDGTVSAVGMNSYGQCDVSEWSEVVKVIAGRSWTLGLRRDGTVLATGLNEFGQCEVSSWKNVVDIETGYNHTVALCADGTVLAVGDNRAGQCNTSDWSDIVEISAGWVHTVGLHSDGTVVSVGSDYIPGLCNTRNWNNIQIP